MSKAQRIERLLRVQEIPELAVIEREKCRRDVIYFILNYVHTHDPRPDLESKRPIGLIPFALYEFQFDLVRKIRDKIASGDDLLIEKSRDMGATWVTVAVIVWYFLFTPDFSARLGSRNVNEVDKIGDIGTLFEKARTIIRNLPRFLRPMHFSETKHMPYLRVINPQNRATIVGETANPNFGRSGRNTVAVFDEFAFWDNDNAAWESCGQTTPCRIGISTPYGNNNRFAKMAQGKLDDKPEKITLHWKLHPKHDDAWYERQKTRYTPSGLAREVDISYALSVEGRVFEVFDYALHVKTIGYCDPTVNPHRLYVPDPNHPITVAFDFGRVCAALFSQIDDYYNIDVFHEIILDGEEGRPKGTTEELAVAVLATMDRYNALHPSRQHDLRYPSAYTYRFTGDPAGETKPWQTKGAFCDHEILAQRALMPLQIDKVIRARNRLQSGVSLLQTILNTRYNGRERLLIHNPEKTPTLISALQGEYRWKLDRNNDKTDTVDEKHPFEDVVDCLRYTALQFADILPDRSERPRKGKKLESPYVFPV